MLERRYGGALSEQIISGLSVKRLTTFRVNTLKTDAESVSRQLECAGIRYTRPAWYGDAFILTEAGGSAVRSLDMYEKGEIYMQSLSSMIPPLVLDPREGECVLDMAAAPGGKTTQMSALSGGRAQITACEKNRIRAERLRFNLRRQGARGTAVLEQDAIKLDPLFSFDKILLDAPCSGSGTLEFYRDKVNTHFTEELVSRSVKTQEAMLRKALRLIKPGRFVVYSTCSVLEEENEGVVSRVLSDTKARLVPIDSALMSALPLLPSKLEGTCLIRPSELYEGFFTAKIVRL